MLHPYKSQPIEAFWGRSISQNWDAISLRRESPILTSQDRIVSLGSCFAANLVPHLKKSGYTYIEEEPRHTAFDALPPENFSYEKFSAAYGNVYTPRQFLQLLDRVEGRFSPAEDRWFVGTEIVDPFRPGLRYRARTVVEYEALTQSHLMAVRRAFSKATVVIFTLGLTEAWMSKQDGAVFPACPGTVSGAFDDSKHIFHNFTVKEVVEDLGEIIGRLRAYREDIRLLLTVSPVPLVATATKAHVLEASTYSKSVLRAACGEIAGTYANASYFPAYEIITGPQAPDDYFESDRRNVSQKGIESVMQVFFASCADATHAIAISTSSVDGTPREMARRMVIAECEEAASEL